MRWLVVILILDVVLVVWLIGGAGHSERADLVFVSGSEHRFLDPQRITWSLDIRVANCLFEPLVQIKLPEMTPEPGAAQRWTVSADERTYTFYLREDAVWSSGDPVTADDFIFAWRRALMPDFAADYTQLLWCIRGAKDFFHFRQQQLVAYSKLTEPSREQAQESITQAEAHFTETVGLHAPDSRTLVVELERPTHYFLSLCAFATFMPVHKVSVQSQISVNADTGRMIQDPYWTRPDRIICNGPFVLARRRFKRDLLLTQNPLYWNRDAVGVTSILELIVSEPQTALLMYDAGQVDWLPDLPAAGTLAADLLAQDRGDVNLGPAAGTYFYNFNCSPALPDGRPNPLADARVRRALSMAIDRKTIVERVTRLNQPIARSFVPHGSIPGYDAPVDAGIVYDPAAARKLLAQTGHANGKGLDGLSILYNTGASHEKIAQQIKRNWKQELGIGVTLEGQEVAVFGDRLRNTDFSICRAGWYGDYVDPTTFLDKFRKDNGNNDASYADNEFEELMRRADDEPDSTKRMALLREAETIILRDQPIAPIFQYVRLQVFDPARVRNMHMNPWGYRRLDLVEVVK